MSTRRTAYPLCLMLTMGTAIAGDYAVDAYDRSGYLSFEEIPDAITYRIEWTHDVTEGWTNFAGDTGQWMDAIPATGTGTVTVAVPMFYRVVAEMPPTGMVFIPAGSFVMGNSTNVFPAAEGSTNELPQHEVYTDAFYCDKYEVTQTRYVQVRGITAYLSYAYSGGYPSTL
ncbi:MAG: SUMF1/EgtB/PvdO family nonheme iron enzyme, partial [Verrucomicrobia bacterium]|nr:SUMF1/EgtB/PvdO family nonheme iron enzyme [Verrucomicrobiota bacterium]